MSIDELCALPVETLAEKDCLLFLWATFPQLPETLRLIQAWGFTFKTVAFVWLKLNKKSPTWFYGLGYWTRGNAEICLLAKRGKPKRRSAGLTAKFEEKLKLVEKGDCNVDDFVADYEAFIRSELDKITDVMAAW